MKSLSHSRRWKGIRRCEWVREGGGGLDKLTSIFKEMWVGGEHERKFWQFDSASAYSSNNLTFFSVFPLQPQSSLNHLHNNFFSCFFAFFKISKRGCGREIDDHYKSAQICWSNSLNYIIFKAHWDINISSESEGGRLLNIFILLDWKCSKMF